MEDKNSETSLRDGIVPDDAIHATNNWEVSTSDFETPAAKITGLPLEVWLAGIKTSIYSRFTT